MTGKTSIEWTAMPGYVGAVWNPTTGCTRVSAGCDNCYAFSLHDKRFASNLKAAKDAGAHRMNAIGQLTVPETIVYRARSGAIGPVELPWPKQYDLPFSRVQLLEDRLDVPLRTRKPTCYFVDSMADLFHESVPFEFIDHVWISMIDAPQHRFLILTKRPERMREYVLTHGPDSAARKSTNIWLGTSVEDQRAADERIPHLLATPAAVRFLSCEPLLGPVDLVAMFQDGRFARELERGVAHYNVRFDWVIVGGESGPRARPFDLAWARSLRDQCAAAGVAYFVKQLGSKPCARDDEWIGRVDRGAWTLNPQHDGAAYYPKLREPHGRRMDEWPLDLRIREFPNGAR